MNKYFKRHRYEGEKCVRCGGIDITYKFRMDHKKAINTNTTCFIELEKRIGEK